MTRSDPWTPAFRKRLTASRRGVTKEPKPCFLTADQAFAMLGGAGPAPTTLVAEDEDARAIQHRNISWKTTTGRIFCNEAWNPLIALWSARGGWDFVFDRLLTATGMRSEYTYGPWYGVRRYLHAASDADLAIAVARVGPIFDALYDSPHFTELRQRDIIAFAFDRAGWATRLLRDYVDKKLPTVVEISALIAATTDIKLARAASKRYGGVDRNLYNIFDLVETHGAAAAPLLALYQPFDAPDRKRIAQAIALSTALG